MKSITINVTFCLQMYLSLEKKINLIKTISDSSDIFEN